MLTVACVEQPVVVVDELVSPEIIINDLLAEKQMDVQEDTNNFVCIYNYNYSNYIIIM